MVRLHSGTPFHFIEIIGPSAEIEHREFLHDANTDSSRHCAQALIQGIGPKGSVVAYHASFEKQRLKEMRIRFPDLADPLDSIIGRLWDLETPFSKRWYWNHRFQGSSSIECDLAKPLRK